MAKNKSLLEIVTGEKPKKAKNPFEDKALKLPKINAKLQTVKGTTMEVPKLKGVGDMKIKKLHLRLTGLNNQLSMQQSILKRLQKQIANSVANGVSTSGLFQKQKSTNSQIDIINEKIAGLKSKLKELGIN